MTASHATTLALLLGVAAVALFAGLSAAPLAIVIGVALHLAAYARGTA